MSSILVLLLTLFVVACGSKGGDSGGGPANPNVPPAKPTPVDEPPIVLDPLPGYKPVSSVFSDPMDVVRASDTASTLYKLRQIASPTTRYHVDLINIAKAAGSLDYAHLMVLIDACYYNSQEISDMQAELKRIEGQTDRQSRVTRARLMRDLQTAAELAVYVNRIIYTGLAKTANYDFDRAVLVLERLFPGADTGSVFAMAIKKVGPLSAERELQVMDLASKKGAHRTAAELALDWFQNHSDRSYATLLAAASRLKEEGKDYFLLEAVKQFSRLSLEQVVELAHAAYSAEGEVAALAYGKTGQYSHANVLRIAQQLTENGRPAFFLGALDYYTTLTVSQLNELLDAAKTLRNEIAVKAVDKVSDLSPSRAVDVTSRLQYGGKDIWLTAALKKIDHLNTNELIAMMGASYQEKAELSLLALNKLSDLNHANALKVASQLSYGAKDNWLSEVLNKKLDRLTTDELIALMQASYQSASEFAMAALDKVSDLNLANALRVAAELHYGAKDEWLEAVLKKKITSLTTAELLSVMRASYQSRSGFAMYSLSQLSDFGFDNVLTVAAELNYGAKDEWLEACLKKLDRLTTAELIRVMKASYQSASSFATASLDKLTDLNTANALLVAAELHYGAKDEWLQSILNNKVTKLTTDDLIAYMKASYQSASTFAMDSLKKISDLTPANALLVAAELHYGSKDEWLGAAFTRFKTLKTADLKAAIEASYQDQESLATSLLGRVSDLTVQNAIVLAELLHYGSKDTFLLKAVGLVTDLTKGNLESLVSHAYQSQDEIRTKGLKRLGSSLR